MRADARGGGRGSAAAFGRGGETAPPPPLLPPPNTMNALPSPPHGTCISFPASPRRQEGNVTKKATKKKKKKKGAAGPVEVLEREDPTRPAPILDWAEEGGEEGDAAAGGLPRSRVGRQGEGGREREGGSGEGEGGCKGSSERAGAPRTKVGVARGVAARGGAGVELGTVDGAAKQPVGKGSTHQSDLQRKEMWEGGAAKSEEAGGESNLVAGTRGGRMEGMASPEERAVRSPPTDLTLSDAVVMDFEESSLTLPTLTTSDSALGLRLDYEPMTKKQQRQEQRRQAKLAEEAHIAALASEKREAAVHASAMKALHGISLAGSARALRSAVEEVTAECAAALPALAAAVASAETRLGLPHWSEASGGASSQTSSQCGSAAPPSQPPRNLAVRPAELQPHDLPAAAQEAAVYVEATVSEPAATPRLAAGLPPPPPREEGGASSKPYEPAALLAYRSSEFETGADADDWSSVQAPHSAYHLQTAHFPLYATHPPPPHPKPTHPISSTTIQFHPTQATLYRVTR